MWAAAECDAWALLGVVAWCLFVVEVRECGLAGKVWVEGAGVEPD